MEALQSESKWAEAFREYVRPGRITLVVIAFGVELVLLFGAMVFPVSPAEQQVLSQEANTLLGVKSVTPLALVAEIFLNNIRVALLEMVPLVGVIFFVASIVTTGQVVQVLGVSRSPPVPPILLGTGLFAFPFAIAELAAYAIAVVAGLRLISSAFGHRFRAEVRIFALEICVVAGTLAVAAAMETAGIFNTGVGFALWVPFVIGAYFLDRRYLRPPR